MAEERIWTAALLVIGDEILSGRTQDKNIAQVAAWLNRQGIRLAEVRVVPDDLQRIADAGNELRTTYDYLLTTGGIVSNSGITMTRLGRRVAAFSYVGDDAWAEVKGKSKEQAMQEYVSLVQRLEK